ncbi:SCF ubiquitin ligase complex subunit cdc4, partial [Coelomomyces lativittatus]
MPPPPLPPPPPLSLSSSLTSSSPSSTLHPPPFSQLMHLEDHPMDSLPSSLPRPPSLSETSLHLPTIPSPTLLSSIPLASTSSASSSSSSSSSSTGSNVSTVSQPIKKRVKSADLSSTHPFFPNVASGPNLSSAPAHISSTTSHSPILLSSSTSYASHPLESSPETLPPSPIRSPTLMVPEVLDPFTPPSTHMTSSTSTSTTMELMPHVSSLSHSSSIRTPEQQQHQLQSSSSILHSHHDVNSLHFATPTLVHMELDSAGCSVTSDAMAIDPMTPSSRSRHSISPVSHLSLSPSTSTSTSPYSFYPPTLSNANTTTPSSSSSLHTSFSTLQQLPSLLLHYDRLPEQLQHYILFQLLRRSSVSCLHLISSLVQPALKRDFIALLPYEIAMNILYRLDAKTLCRGARVSSRWRTLIDGNARLWKFQGYQEGLWGSEGTSTTLKLRNPHLVLALQQQAQQCHVEIDWSLFTSPDAFQDLVSRAYSPSLPFPSLTTSTAIASTPTSATTSIFTTTPTPATTTTTTTNHHHHHHHHHNNVHSSNSGGSNVLPLQVGGTMMMGAGILGEEKKEKSGLPLYVPGVLPLATPHPFKHMFQRSVELQRNWMIGRHKTISFIGHANAVVTCLQFDDTKIVSGSDDQTICVYDIRTGKLIRTLEGHDGGVWALQYVGNTLVSGSTDRTVRVWDLSTGKTTHIFKGHTSTVRCLQILLPVTHPIEKKGYIASSTCLTYSVTPMLTEPLIVTGSRDATLRVWRLPDPTQHSNEESPQLVDDSLGLTLPHPYFRHVLIGHDHSVRALAGHGHLVCSGSYDGTVRVWDVVKGECRWRLMGHTQKVYSIVYDGQTRCWSGSMDATIRCWDVSTGQCIALMEGHTSLVGLLELNPSFLVSAAADSTLRIWDLNTHRSLHVLQAHHNAITCFQFDRYKVVSGSEGAIKLWNPNTGLVVRDLITRVTNVWRLQMNERWCVAAVNRNDRTEFVVLDFDVSEEEVISQDEEEEEEEDDDD